MAVENRRLRAKSLNPKDCAVAHSVSRQKIRSRKRAIRVLQTQCWYQAVLSKAGVTRPFHLEKLTFPAESFRENALGEKSHRNTWRRYRSGKTRPSEWFVQAIDRIYPKTAAVFFSPLWRLLENIEDIDAIRMGLPQPIAQTLLPLVLRGSHIKLARIRIRRLCQRGLLDECGLEPVATVVALLAVAGANRSPSDMHAFLCEALIATLLGLGRCRHRRVVAALIFDYVRNAGLLGDRLELDGYDFRGKGGILLQLCDPIVEIAQVPDTLERRVEIDLAFGCFGEYLMRRVLPLSTKAPPCVSEIDNMRRLADHLESIGVEVGPELERCRLKGDRRDITHAQLMSAAYGLRAAKCSQLYDKSRTMAERRE